MNSGMGAGGQGSLEPAERGGRATKESLVRTKEAYFWKTHLSTGSREAFHQAALGRGPQRGGHSPSPAHGCLCVP